MHCIKDKKKVCPAKAAIRISGNGVVSQDSEALLKCCKVKAQIEEAKKYFGRPACTVLSEIQERGEI